MSYPEILYYNLNNKYLDNDLKVFYNELIKKYNDYIYALNLFDNINNYVFRIKHLICDYDYFESHIIINEYWLKVIELLLYNNVPNYIYEIYKLRYKKILKDIDNNKNLKLDSFILFSLNYLFV